MCEYVCVFYVCACICAKYVHVFVCVHGINNVRECVFVIVLNKIKMQMYTVNDVLLWAHLNCMCVRVPACVCMCVGVFVQILLFLCVLV